MTHSRLHAPASPQLQSRHEPTTAVQFGKASYLSGAFSLDWHAPGRNCTGTGAADNCRVLCLVCRARLGMRAADVAKIESDRMTDLKKPGVAFWATVVVVGLVGYALTFGR